MRRYVLGIVVLASLLYGLNWQIETVENEPVGEFSFALDRQGYPWILFERDSTLYLKHKDGEDWRTEIVDTVSFGSPRVSVYGDEIWIAQGGYHPGLWTYHREANGWSKTCVDSTNVEQLDLAVDSKGFPHICYIWSKKGEIGKWVRYATIRDNLWKTEYIDTSWVFSQSFYPSITMDEDNRPHVSYAGNVFSTPPIAYAFRDTQGWQVDGPWHALSLLPSTKVSITLDLNGMPHITAVSGAELNHFWRGDTGWIYGIIESTYPPGGFAYNIPCEIDSEGILHIAYMFLRKEAHDLFYAFRTDTGWIKEIVDTIGVDVRSWCDMRLDSLGYPHIVYPTSSGLNYAIGRPESQGARKKPHSERPFRVSISPTISKSSFSICYSLPEKTHISIAVYNSSGQLIKTLVDEEKKPGKYTLIWNGRDGKGKELASGVYFLRLKARGFEKTRRVVLVR